VLNVLVVDDSLFMRKSLEKLLEELGHKVVKAVKDGHEAVSAYETLHPDLVTMDIDMPIMNGLEALSVIKRKHKDANIIMTTAKGSDKIVKASIRAGAKNYILKPITVQKLHEAIIKIFPEETMDLNTKREKSQEKEKIDPFYELGSDDD